MKENCLLIVFRMTTKRKHSEVTLKTKYEALEEFDKNRPNKEATIQFNVPRSALSTWRQPISIIFYRIDCFRIFWTTCRGNYRRRWWKWRWGIQWTNRTSLKKWSWQDRLGTLNRLGLFTEDLSFDPFNLKANPHNQSLKR